MEASNDGHGSAGSVEQRLARLEAVHAIRTLKLDYANLCDAGYPPVELSQMFTEDAIWRGGERFGDHVGRQAIHDFFAGVSGDLVYAMHFMIGDTIEVGPDLQTAKGSWQLLQPVTMRLDGEPQALWFSAHYADEYRLVDGRWYFSSVSLTWNMQARHATGWAEQRLQLG
jgi:hypothetical protein